MTDPVPVSLGHTQETLLIPLYGRATMTRAGSPLITDRKAVEMVERLDYDFTRFDGSMSLLGSVFRTRVYDRWVEQWLRANPTGTVVEVGVGLNTRYERVDNGEARWIEIDLPDAMALRREFFADTDRRTMLAASITDTSWIEAVRATGGPWFFSSEAVLIYLEPGAVRSVLATIGAEFPGSSVAFDTWSTWMRDHQNEHDTISAMDAEFRWFCDDVAALDIPGIKVEVQASFAFVDAPPELLELLTEEFRAFVPALAEDPQTLSYRQNLVTLH